MWLRDSHLPKSARDLTINLVRNRLVALPDTICEMWNLVDLSVRENITMKGLPADIGNFRDMEMLILSGNNLTGLPRDIGKCKRLNALYITGNKITTLNEALSRCPLRLVRAQNCPLESVQIVGFMLLIADVRCIATDRPGWMSE